MVHLYFRLNFSDAEIEIFCAKYDRDGNFEFDLDKMVEVFSKLNKMYDCSATKQKFK